jgi:hypothetical protein
VYLYICFFCFLFSSLYTCRYFPFGSILRLRYAFCVLGGKCGFLCLFESFAFVFSALWGCSGLNGPKSSRRDFAHQFKSDLRQFDLLAAFGQCHDRCSMNANRSIQGVSGASEFFSGISGSGGESGVPAQFWLRSPGISSFGGPRVLKV